MFVLCYGLFDFSLTIIYSIYTVQQTQFLFYQKCNKRFSMLRVYVYQYIIVELFWPCPKKKPKHVYRIVIL